MNLTEFIKESTKIAVLRRIQRVFTKYRYIFRGGCFIIFINMSARMAAAARDLYALFGGFDEFT